MSFGIDDVSTFLGLLARHADVVGHAYAQRVVELTEDTAPAILKLAQKRVLVRHGETEYRLARSLRGLLDVAFQRQRHYAISENFSEQITRLFKLAEDYQAALFNSHLDDAELYEEEFGEGVFDICDSIDSSLLRLRTLTSNHFANVRTVEEKLRQNAHYLDYAKRLGDAMTLLECNDSLIDALESHSAMAPLLALYQRIPSRLPGWRRQHSATMTQLREYFYRIRQIQPRARRVRSMAMYLRNNPDYQFPEVEALTTVPDWASRFEGLAVSIPIDVFDFGVQDTLTDVAAGLKGQTVVRDVKRTAGTLSPDANKEVVEEIPMRPIDRLFEAFVDAVKASPQPVSAVQWWAANASRHGFSGVLNARHWLMKIMNAMDNLAGRIGRYRELDYRLQLAEQSYARSGNLEIEDVEVWRKTA